MNQSKQQPDVTTALMDALNYLLEQTVDQDLASGIELTEGEREARDKAICALADADQARRRPQKDLVADIQRIALRAAEKPRDVRPYFFIGALTAVLLDGHSQAASQAVDNITSAPDVGGAA